MLLVNLIDAKTSSIKDKELRTGFSKAPSKDILLH